MDRVVYSASARAAVKFAWAREDSDWYSAWREGSRREMQGGILVVRSWVAREARVWLEVGLRERSWVRADRLARQVSRRSSGVMADWTVADCSVMPVLVDEGVAGRGSEERDTPPSGSPSSRSFHACACSS